MRRSLVPDASKTVMLRRKIMIEDGLVCERSQRRAKSQLLGCEGRSSPSGHVLDGPMREAESG